MRETPAEKGAASPARAAMMNALSRPGHLPQSLDHPQGFGFDRQAIDDEVVVHRQLNAEKKAHAEDGDGQ